MGDKKVINPLFSNAVTGGTFEDFSQNAVLLPAMEKPAPSKEILQPQFQLTPDTAATSSIDYFQQPQNLSGFSNLSIQPAEAAPQQLIPVENTPPMGVPPTNSYRRSAIKKPTYAPVPGLSNQITQPENYFKPIAPQPSSFLIPQTNPISVPPQNFFTPTEPSPVMEAISPNEFLQPVEGNQASQTRINTNSQIYRPVYHHWFYKKEQESKILWEPFSMMDSLQLDKAFTSNDLDPENFVPTDGGRFDVNILKRERVPVYWKGPSTEVRRCSWFNKSSDGRYLPYEENIATMLEEEYKICYETNQWHKKLKLPNGDFVNFQSPDIIDLNVPSQSPDVWGNSPVRPTIVKRGMDEFDIDEGEPTKIDHLLFIIHGIGSVCDLKFRTVEEVVDEFRTISLQLVQSHYKSSCERGLANRMEVLPIGWHHELHSDSTGIDTKLKNITLDSSPRLRSFTNNTLLDVLFYGSPVYCQTIISAVGNQLNRVYELFKQRNPDYNGAVSLGGHSLGSVILFDLLRNQNSDISSADTINYPTLIFEPQAFFALGSPISMFITVRGLDNLGEDFKLPTCPAFYNIFHPYDPVAYRVEPLVNPELSKLKPFLIPHHKGRKRMHLELKETMARVGADLKQRILDSMKSTWNSFYQLAKFHRQDETSLEEEVDRAIKEQLEKSQEESNEVTDLCLGLLNNNRRIDYVLQEAPFEIFNEYLFAITSHVCYWESEDTMLLILKEVYDSINVTPDDQLPVPNPTVERVPSKNVMGMNPTETEVNLTPPPLTGFIRKS